MKGKANEGQDILLDVIKCNCILYCLRRCPGDVYRGAMCNSAAANAGLLDREKLYLLSET